VFLSYISYISHLSYISCLPDRVYASLIAPYKYNGQSLHSWLALSILRRARGNSRFVTCSLALASGQLPITIVIRDRDGWIMT